MATRKATTVVVGDESATASSGMRDSIEVTRDAKGLFKFVVKMYFDRVSEGEEAVVESALQVYENLSDRFER